MARHKNGSGSTTPEVLKTAFGTGGETQQTGSGAKITTNHGVPISDNQNSLKAGGRGPSLLEDFVLREKIHHFDHERIPERIVHARGSAAHGFFELTESLEEYLKRGDPDRGRQENGGFCTIFDRRRRSRICRHPA